MNECPCSRPTDAWLCKHCLASMTQDIAGIPELLLALRPVIAKTAKAGAQPGAPATGSRPPINIYAFVAADELERWRGYSVKVMSQHEVIRDHKPRVEAAVKAAEAILDPSPARVIVGPCYGECPGRVMAAEGEHEGRCDTCGYTVEVDAYRKSRTHKLLNAGEVIRVLKDAGLNVTQTDIDLWVHRGRLAPADTITVSGKRHHMYRLTDVYELGAKKRKRTS